MHWTIKDRLKKLALKNLFESASTLVERVQKEEFKAGAPIPANTSKEALIRMVNRHRADFRPKDPTPLADLQNLIVSCIYFI